MVTQLAEQAENTPTANPVAVLRQSLSKMEPEFKAALPPHISPEKFQRVAMTAIQQTPALVEADRRSLFGAIIRLAQDGLLPDGREAALVIFNQKNGNQWVKSVQAMPMIAGVLKRIRQSGEVAKVSAHVVYANDDFTVSYGFDEDVSHHPPALDKPRGKPIGAYATAVLKDGSRLLEVMSLEEIEKVRSVSRAKDRGPWVDWFEEMARKTVMRRLSKRLPMSTDLEEQVFRRDETMATTIAPLAVVEDLTPAAPALSHLDAIEQSIEGDGETAEDATFEPSEDENGEDPRKAAAEAIVARLAEAETLVDVKAIEKETELDVAAMPDTLASAISLALENAKKRVKGDQ